VKLASCGSQIKLGTHDQIVKEAAQRGGKSLNVARKEGAKIAAAINPQRFDRLWEWRNGGGVSPRRLSFPFARARSARVQPERPARDS
jgi:hypothetical protein